MKNKLKLYLKLMSIPFCIFLALFIVSIILAPTPNHALGYFLFLFSLFLIIALRNLFIIFDSKDEDNNEE